MSIDDDDYVETLKCVHASLKEMFTFFAPTTSLLPCSRSKCARSVS